MKLKNSFFYTLREDVKDEDSVSGNLLVRAGFIKKNSAGVYMMLPMGKSATPWRSALAHYFPKKVRLRQDSGSKGLKVNGRTPKPLTCL